MGGPSSARKLGSLEPLSEWTGSSLSGGEPQEGEAGVGLSRKARGQGQPLTGSRALCSAWNSTWETAVSGQFLKDQIKNRGRRQRDSTVVKVLAAQAWGPEFHPPEPIYKTRRDGACL